MRLLLAARERAFPVLNFLLLCLCPSFLVPYFYFPVYFSILAFSSLFALFLIAFPFALFCSSAKPLLNPRTIRGFSLYKNAPPRKGGAHLLRIYIAEGEFVYVEQSFV